MHCLYHSPWRWQVVPAGQDTPVLTQIALRTSTCFLAMLVPAASTVCCSCSGSRQPLHHWTKLLHAVTRCVAGSQGRHLTYEGRILARAVLGAVAALAAALGPLERGRGACSQACSKVAGVALLAARTRCELAPTFTRTAMLYRVHIPQRLTWR